MADGGYDVVTYRDIDPLFGTLAEAERLIAEARDLGLRSIIDIVPNHVSAEHPWFRAALASAPGTPERQRFWFRPGRGPRGDEPPNGWASIFGGKAWTRAKSADGSPGEWYLHLFAPEQPDLNWDNEDVRAEHEDVLRFWFDRGASGVRIDSAALLVKDPVLREVEPGHGPGGHVHVDRDELHDIYRSWRAVADSYAEPRVLIGELWLDDQERLARYLRADEMHTAFNFEFLSCPWDASRIRETITRTLETHAGVPGTPTWVLSNHDVTRPVTRYGRIDTSFAFEAKRHGIHTDLELGERRARAAALLSLALPGSAYIYQGEELGLPEFEDIDPERIQDPMHFRSGGVDPGRDGARVPMPWRGDEPPYGFSPDGTDTWLPQPDDWADRTVAAQRANVASAYWLYRNAITIRRAEPDLRGDTFGWLDLGPDVVAFTRGHHLVCAVNFGSTAVALPKYDSILLASAPPADGKLAPDAAAWLRIAPQGGDAR